MAYWVYLLTNRSGTLYVGVTNNIVRRIAEHKARTVPGFASRYRLDRLVYLEEHVSIRDAIAREKQVKAWRREKKVALINEENPAWRDLAVELESFPPSGGSALKCCSTFQLHTFQAMKTFFKEERRHPELIEGSVFPLQLRALSPLLISLHQAIACGLLYRAGRQNRRREEVCAGGPTPSRQRSLGCARDDGERIAASPSAVGSELRPPPPLCKGSRTSCGDERSPLQEGRPH